MLPTMNRSLCRTFLNHNLINATPVAWSCTWTTLGSTFNTRAERKLNLSLARENAGLFDVPHLQSYEGFYYLKDKCIEQTDRLISEATRKDRTRKLVEIFDDLSDNLCRVADLAEFIRIAHPSAAYAQAAEIASGTVSGIVEKLNTNRDLYCKLSDVISKGDIVPTTEVDTHVGQLFLFDFEQSGIHLPEEDRMKVLRLNDTILNLGQHFVAGCTKPSSVKRSVLPENIKHMFAGNEEDILIGGLCADSSIPVVRELIYRIYLYPDKHQEYLLNELLKARFELAQICGFDTYAHRALKGSTIESPEMVMEFLNCLSDGLRVRADEDFSLMAKMKETDYSGPLEVWDAPYYTKKIKKHQFNVQNSEYAPYFSLGACMEGLNNLLVNLYGISFVPEEIKTGECWAQDVYKLAVTHETEGLLGYIYCDFYERSGKPNQDCHFTIQGGRRLPNGSYQLPIVVLMLNLPLPIWSSPTLLSPGMVDNLFHEIGHAMHSMLARTQYQHVTGTRCSTDFAEVPSVLMEYFASDVRVLRTFAKHFQTHEPMPEKMLQKLCASKHVCTASETQIQLFYAALDQIYHGKHPLLGSSTNVLAEAQGQYYNLPYVDHTAWQLRFSHLVGYGAKYYSYLVSRALASCIWQSYFENDPLNRTQGERYRQECLAHGGGKPPRQLLTDFLNTEVTTQLLVDSLLKDIDSKQRLVQKYSKGYLQTTA